MNERIIQPHLSLAIARSFAQCVGVTIYARVLTSAMSETLITVHTIEQLPLQLQLDYIQHYFFFTPSNHEW